MKKLFPVILAIIGLALGTGAGMFLKPTEAGKPAGEGRAASEQAASEALTAEHGANAETASSHETPPSEGEQASQNTAPPEDDTGEGHEFVKLNNQFVVPVVNGSKIASLVVMSLSIEVASGDKEKVFGREPKLRDAFLQVLFDHANSGGFDGAFTSGQKMSDLRGSLLEAAVRVLGPTTSNVLVIDIVRQDV